MTAVMRSPHHQLRGAKRSRASPPLAAVSTAPAAVAGLPLTSGTSECQTVEVNLQQQVDFVK